jgi:class 3 adenylate cyclase
MSKITLEEQFKMVPIGDGQKFLKLLTLSNEQVDMFNPDVLGLGDIGSPSTRVEALAALFDLSGFTNFCSQVDPHLGVPEYLSRFLGWLFTEIKEGCIKERDEEETILWASLPFLAKFLGDGVLFLWDTKSMGGAEICNVVTSLWEICGNYVRRFFPMINKTVVQPPKTLRCGVSRGMVFSVGNGEDYVGPCINIAARLQKLSSLTFCLSRRGFDIEKHMPEETAEKYVLKFVSLRGIGENELVWVRQEEFDNLENEEKALFGSP